MTDVDERSTYIDKARRKVLSRSSTLTYSDMPYCAPGGYNHGPLGVGHRPTGPSSPVPRRAAVAGPSALRAVNKRPRDSEGARGPVWDAGQGDRGQGGSMCTPVKVKHRKLNRSPSVIADTDPSVPVGSSLGYSAPPLTPQTSFRAVTPLPPSRVRFSALVSPDHGEVEFHLSPHALSAIDRMKQDTRFQDPLKAQETQEDLFRRAASFTPARFPLTPDHRSLTAGGPSGQVLREDETSPSSGDEYGLDPPPYRSPSRAMSVESPPRYRLFTHEPSPVVVPPQNGPRGLPPLPRRGSGQHPDLFYANTAVGARRRDIVQKASRNASRHDNAPYQPRTVPHRPLPASPLAQRLTREVSPSPSSCTSTRSSASSDSCVASDVPDDRGTPAPSPSSSPSPSPSSSSSSSPSPSPSLSHAELKDELSDHSDSDPESHSDSDPSDSDKESYHQDTMINQSLFHSPLRKALHFPKEEREGLDTIPPLGLPVSAAGGLPECIDAVKTALASCKGMSCASIMFNCPKRFTKPSRRKDNRSTTSEAVFRMRLEQLGPKVNMVAHAAYTGNLASHKKHVREASLRNLQGEMEQAYRLGIPVLIFHLGSNSVDSAESVREICAASLRKVLNRVPDVTLAIETMTARCKGETSCSLKALATLLHLVNMPGRLKICVDLCHILQQYDIVHRPGRRAFFEAIGELGFDNVAAMHLSDSFTPHGSDQDRHANLLCGVIPIDAFREILRHPGFKHTPVILETPAYFPNLRIHHGSLATRARLLELARRQEELDFLSRAVLYNDEEWPRYREGLKNEWRQRKRDLERVIRRVICERIAGVAAADFAAYRKVVRSNIQSAGAYRRMVGRGSDEMGMPFDKANGRGGVMRSPRSAVKKEEDKPRVGSWPGLFRSRRRNVAEMESVELSPARQRKVLSSSLKRA